MARQLRRSAAGAVVTQAPRKSTPRLLPRPGLGQQGRGLRQFIGEIRSELRKVVWPTREQAVKLTALVVGISVAIGFLLGIIDYAFAELFRTLLR